MSSSHDPRHGQVLSESFLWIILFVKVKLWFLFGKVLEKLKKKNTSKTFPPTKGGGCIYVVLTLESQVVDYDGSGQLEYKVFPLGSGLGVGLEPSAWGQDDPRLGLDWLNWAFGLSPR